MTTLAPKEMEKPAIRSNLPPGFTFSDPRMGFAQGSIKSPIGCTDIFHCVDVDEDFHTVYLLVAANLFDSNSPLELYFIFMKRHLNEGWYFADGVVLSSDCTCATRFLVQEPVYERIPEELEEVNRRVQRMVPEMLRKSGVPNIQPILCTKKYTWFVL